MTRKEKRAILFGMLLGDGCLKTKSHPKLDGKISTYYEYVICHSIKQEAYLRHKLELFHSIVGGKKPNVYYEKSKLGESLRFSRCHRSFRLYHKRLYWKSGKKTLTRQILDWMTPHALAIWYMDDGGVSLDYRKDGTVSSCQMRLATYCVVEQADLIIAYFSEVWNVGVKKHLHKKTNSYYLSMNTKEGKKFEEIISPYIIPSMEYKLPSKRIARVPDTLVGLPKGDDIV
jgi:recombination protein RecA